MSIFEPHNITIVLWSLSLFFKGPCKAAIAATPLDTFTTFPATAAAGFGTAVFAGVPE